MTDSEIVRFDHELARKLRNGNATSAEMAKAADRLEKLNAEVGRWISAYRIAASQAMLNGQAAAQGNGQTGYRPIY